MISTEEEQAKDERDADTMELILSKSSLLEGFRREYGDLQKKYEDISLQLISQERENDSLTQELSGIREAVTFTRRNIDEVRASQESLRENIEVIASKRNILSDREKNSRDEISEFTSKFEELKTALAAGSDWTPQQKDERIALEKERDFLATKLENRTNQVSNLRSEVDRLYALIQTLEAEATSADERVEQISKRMKELRGVASSLIKKREDSETKVFESRAAVVKANEDLQERQRLFNTEDRSLHALDQSLEANKVQMDTYLQDYESLYRTLQETSAELERQKVQNRKVEEEIAELENSIKDRTKEADGVLKEIAQVRQVHEVAQKKAEEIEEEKRKAEEKRDQLIRDATKLRENDVITVRREVEAQEKMIAASKGELEVLRKRSSKVEQASKSLMDMIRLNENGKRNLHLEKKLLEEDSERQKEQIRLLLQEKEKYEHDVEIANQRYYTSLEELKLQELQAQELQKKIVEDQAKLKHKQNMYETVRSDRNQYSKQLIECQEEISTLRRKFRGMNHYIDQLKDEISLKDHAIVKEHFLHHSVDKEKELLKNELTKIRKQIQSSEGIIENQRVEILKLSRIIEEAELERARQKNELASVLSERNLLTGQVVKRNYETYTMYDRIKVQRSNLRIGEKEFERIMEQLAQGQQQLVDVVEGYNETVEQLKGIDEWRKKVIKLEQEVRAEQLKARTLSDELDRPMNVHRWRVLESSDPNRFEKITLIQTLQKQLVVKADEVTRHELLIKEKEKVYMELKNIITRQPGPEIEEHILTYQQTLKDKVKQLAAMNEELEMYRHQVASFKDDLANIDAEMTKTKKKWMKTKRLQETNSGGGPGPAPYSGGVGGGVTATMGGTGGASPGTGAGTLAGSMSGANFGVSNSMSFGAGQGLGNSLSKPLSIQQ